MRPGKEKWEETTYFIYKMSPIFLQPDGAKFKPSKSVKKLGLVPRFMFMDESKSVLETIIQ